jgi:transposase-like protein
MSYKVCNKCGENKLLSEFHKGKTKDGHQYTCKVCKYEYSIKNKEQENIRKSNWRLSNPEKIKQSKQKYYQKTKKKK